MGADVTSLTADQQALLALRSLRTRLDEVERAAREPIAIVGMACRLPGSADSLSGYWDALVQAQDLVTEIPAERMDVASIFDSRPQLPGKSCTMRAGMLEKYSHFDADFFGISPREAVTTDPQHRLLLEVSWEALEHATIDPHGLVGSNTGVFIGISGSEYSQALQKAAARKELTAHMLQGSALNAAAGRLSYFYGLNGPSIAIDTACSSSLVAVDRACRSLREGEIGVAIAGGANFLASPESLIIASQWGMLSCSGSVRAFDAAADGFVRGEGCGIVILKRLSDAQRDGDRVLAVIIGSAVNQDGASSGLTVPNGLAQQALLHEAHRRAQVEPWQVGYVEAHGTGTALGDPIEAEALGAVFSGGQQRTAKLFLGSVKTNIGHLESAAGIAGLIKVVLALRYGVIPSQIHFNRPSEHLRWEELPLEVVTEARAWQPIAGRRIAGVSSFGFSGTNAHVVVEGWAQPVAEDEAIREEVLIISARTAPALRDLVGRYVARLVESNEGWSAFCLTAATGRAAFGERLAVVATSRQEAAIRLRLWLEQGALSDGVYCGQVHAGRRAGGHRLDASAPCDDLAAAFVKGEMIDWAARSPAFRLPRVELPTYAFQRERYWMKAEAVEPQQLPGEPTAGGMLGRRLQSAGVRGHFETTLDVDGWIGEHRVEGRVVLPATGHLELMLEAAAELFGSTSGVMLESVVLEVPLVVDATRVVQVVVEEKSDGRSRVRLYAHTLDERAGGGWQRMSEGWLVERPAPRPSPELDIGALQQRLPRADSGHSFYEDLAERGVQFGARFRGLARGWSGDNEHLGEVACNTPDGPGWQLKPWWLDACLQVAALGGKKADHAELYLPLSVERLEIYAGSTLQTNTAATTWSHVTLRQLDAQTVTANLTITDNKGQAIARITNLRFRRLQRKQALAAIYTTSWMEFVGPLHSEDLTGHWVMIPGQGRLGTQVFDELKRQKVSIKVLAIAGIRAASDLSDYTGLQQARKALRACALNGAQIEGVIDLRPIERITFQDAETHATALDLSGVDSCISLLQALVLEQVQLKRGIWFVTRGSASSPSDLSPTEFAIAALLQTAAAELPELAPRSLHIDPSIDAFSLTRALAVVGPPECALRGGTMLVPELAAKTANEAMNKVLNAPQSGLIADLRYRKEERIAPGPHEVEIETEAAGLNFRDLMQSLGMLPATSQPLGGECAGRVIRAGSLARFTGGERVFAFARSGLSRYVVARGEHTRAVPQGLTSSQAAALPVAYLTALHGLHRLAILRAGESVLIHSAAGGLGLAAVHVAQQAGAILYVTAGTEERRAYLRSLGIKHVFSSRDRGFVDEVMTRTKGRGVDVILNSLTGEFARATLGVMARGGRFLEVGKRDTMTPAAASAQRPDVHYLVYDLGEASEADPALIPELLDSLIHSLNAGTLDALPVTEYEEVQEAFQCFARARQIGKVVVTRPVSKSRGAGFAKLSPDASYLVTGAFGGLGVIFAQWLVSHGARELILTGRNPAATRAKRVIEELESQGVVVHQILADIGDREAADSLCRSASGRKPLRGIIHAAGVLDDRGLLQQTPSSLARVMRGKAEGAWNLHLAARDLDLDFFVLSSSATAVVGSPGQVNYAAANGVLDALAMYRKSIGLPGLSVQWGPWNAPGMAEGLRTGSSETALRKMEPEDALACLEELLGGVESVAAVFAGALSAASPENSSRGQVHLPVKTQTLSFLKDRSEPEFRPGVMAYLQQQVFKTLDLRTHADLDPHEPFQALGLDSLMAVEIRNALVADLGVTLPATLLLDYPTPASLTDALIEAVFPNHSTNGSRALDESVVQGMSDAEAEAVLIQELERQP